MVWIREVNIRGPQGPSGPIDPNDPVMAQAAEDAVDARMQEVNIPLAFPSGALPRAAAGTVPMRWNVKEWQFPYEQLYPATYVANEVDHGAHAGELPVLDSAGRLGAAQLPVSVATRDWVLDQIPDPEPPVVEVPERVLPSVLWARIANAKHEGEPVAVVAAGSSTTMNDPGYFGPLVADLQEALWPEVTASDPVWDRDANFPTIYTGPGLHGYSAGDGGAIASDYLTDGEIASIAALDPAIIIHMVGSNDYTQQRNPNVYRADIESVLSKFDAQLTLPCQHVLVHAYAIPDFNPWSFQHRAYGNALSTIAEARGADTLYVDLAIEYQKVGIPGDDPLLLIGPDRVHQRPSGYEFMRRLLSRTFTYIGG